MSEKVSTLLPNLGLVGAGLFFQLTDLQQSALFSCAAHPCVCVGKRAICGTTHMVNQFGHSCCGGSCLFGCFLPSIFPSGATPCAVAASLVGTYLRLQHSHLPLPDRILSRVFLSRRMVGDHGFSALGSVDHGNNLEGLDGDASPSSSAACGLDDTLLRDGHHRSNISN